MPQAAGTEEEQPGPDAEEFQVMDSVGGDEDQKPEGEV